MQASLDLTTLLTIVASSGIGSAAASAVFDWWNRSRHENRSACYLAVRIAHLLEQYALDLCNLIWTHRLHRRSGGHAGTELEGLPEVPALPDDEGYRLLPPNLLDEILSLANKKKYVDRDAELLWETTQSDEVIVSYEHHSMKSALDAFDIAKRLRQHYSMRQSKFISTRAAWLKVDFEEKNAQTEENEAEAI